MSANRPVPPRHAFEPQEVEAVYRAIFERRDMRHFAGGQVPPAQLRRLLEAAHHAPSVGFMQPWRFVRVTDSALRRRLHGAVEEERIVTARALGQREDEFMRLKVEGLLDAAEVLVVVLASGRENHVFGRRTLPQMDLASAACAIQNLWLAARAEGLGMGWVSMFEPASISAMLALPQGAEPIALLCLGPVAAFYEEPLLQQQRWAQREPLANLVYDNGWGQGSEIFFPACERWGCRRGGAPVSVPSPVLVSAGAVVFALILDRAFGEPPARWHPVVWIDGYLRWAGRRIAPRTTGGGHERSFFLAGALAWGVGAAFVALVACSVLVSCPVNS